jgi:hypothetical protein
VEYKLLKMSLLGELTHQVVCIAKKLTNVKRERVSEGANYNEIKLP